MKRDLTDDECQSVVDLYEKMLACKNISKGEQMANQIDKIIKLATYASLDKIALLIHQRNLPMMMKERHITATEKYYTVALGQIGTYPPYQAKKPVSKDKSRI